MLPVTKGAPGEIAAPRALLLDPALSANARVIHVIISGMAQKQGNPSTVSVTHDEILEHLNVKTRKTVIKGLSELRAAGWIDWRTGYRKDGGKAANVYTVNYEPKMTADD